MQTSVTTTCVVLAIALAPPLAGQTTQGLIRGRITNSSTGQGVEGARVYCDNPGSGILVETASDRLGYYLLSPLSADTYHFRVEKDGYQARDIYSLELHVASRVELDIHLLPLQDALDLSRRGVILGKDDAVLPLLGPDLELGHSAPLDLPRWKSSTLQSALSYVIDPEQLGALPLAARNVYTMMVTLPGVVAEEVTGRGLGLAVNGQRPSSANYLLDGSENNDYMLTGPFATLPPEIMQEYRVTTNNFSAEFGRATGFVANAITRSGSNAFHGLVYGYLNNDVLNAATFQQNASAIRRTPQKELEAGYSFGGPIRKERLFFFTSFDRYRNRSIADPRVWNVPIAARMRACAAEFGLDGISQMLEFLDRFPGPQPYFVPPPAADPCDNQAMVGRAQDAAAVSVDRTVLLERLDYRSRRGLDRLSLRGTVSRLRQPEQVYSIYKDFRSDTVRPADGVALGYARSLPHGAFNDLKLSWRSVAPAFHRPHPEIPGLAALTSSDVIDFTGTTLALPGSLLPYAADSRENNWEVNDTFTKAFGSHIVSAGFGALVRRQRLDIPFLDFPVYAFVSAVAAALSAPKYILTGVSLEKALGNPTTYVPPPGARRHYASDDFYGFVQDSWNVTSRWTLNLGVRYEYLGNLHQTGGGDGVVRLTAGDTIQERLLGATVAFPTGSTALYPADRNNWAGRFGSAYSISSKTVLRAGYGVYYDRFFTNLFVSPTNSTSGVIFCTTAPICQSLALKSLSTPVETLLKIEFPVAILTGQPMLWTDPALRTPYTQSWFAGVQQQLTEGWYLEISHTGSLGRKLVANDILNRVQAEVSPSIPLDMNHRSNSGSSTYTALGALVRRRSALADFQASYTWSHAIDNQSDPLLNDVFNLSRFNPENPGFSPQVSTFSQPFNSRIDRGSADFDIRQHLVFYSLWRLPGPRSGWKRQAAAGWQLATLADFRTGLPYSVLYNAGDPDAQTRPDLATLNGAETSAPVPGGVRLLNRSAFRFPAFGSVGTLGRNSFSAPGFWNFDFSLAKSVAAGWLGESRRLEVRADAFNVFNHANLSRPDGNLSSRTFGIAMYGPSGNAPAFPPVTPLYPSPRRIQMQLKLYF